MSVQRRPRVNADEQSRSNPFGLTESERDECWRKARELYSKRAEILNTEFRNAVATLDPQYIRLNKDLSSYKFIDPDRPVDPRVRNDPNVPATGRCIGLEDLFDIFHWKMLYDKLAQALQNRQARAAEYQRAYQRRKATASQESAEAHHTETGTGATAVDPNTQIMRAEPVAQSRDKTTPEIEKAVLRLGEETAKGVKVKTEEVEENVFDNVQWHGPMKAQDGEIWDIGRVDPDGYKIPGVRKRQADYVQEEDFMRATGREYGTSTASAQDGNSFSATNNARTDAGGREMSKRRRVNNLEGEKDTNTQWPGNQNPNQQAVSAIWGNLVSDLSGAVNFSKLHIFRGTIASDAVLPITWPQLLTQVSLSLKFNTAFIESITLQIINFIATMSSSGPSNTSNASSNLTEKQLADSVVEAQDKFQLVHRALELFQSQYLANIHTQRYAKAHRLFDEDREKDPGDYERDVEPFQTQFFAGEERQKKMEAILAKIRARMAKENEEKAAASGGK
ncbi:MAG: hypothetical protein Q9168_002925 [Polycauliona sp. 1 TL-2023]